MARGRHTLTWALLAAAAAGGLFACKQEPPVDPQLERTLSKLKEEVERANRGEAVGQPPGEQDPRARLAQLAASDTPARELPLPAENETVHVGTLAVKLAGLWATGSVRGERVELTTGEQFLDVRLLAQNVGTSPLPLDLGLAHVADGQGHTYPVARDAQRAAGTRPLAREWPVEQREELRLIFEVPPERIGKGLSLVFPAALGGGKDVTLRLD